jgi:cytochrome c biogenesis protein CcdA
MLAALTGLFAGSIHVWAGPDHLAAIAPLAARGQKGSWRDGVRWGMGHSAGVGLVGLLSLWLRELLPLELLSSWGERLVGVMLLGIGIWSLRKVLRHRVHVHQHTHDGEEHLHVHVHSTTSTHDHPRAHVHQHAAVGIGVLHGLAGSSHFLGVLPVLAFPSSAQAAAYLIAFGVGTVASMAVFAFSVGHLAARLALSGERAYRRLMVACSVVAMAVGCFWLLI